MANEQSLTEQEQAEALATCSDALDEWGCTDPAEREKEIQAFIDGGYELWQYEERDIAEVVGHG